MALRILIVEDDFLISTELSIIVEDLGHQVCGQAIDAYEAVTEAARCMPDVVLMDVRLADGTSGIDAAAEIQQCYGIGSIFVSGNIDSAFMEETRRLKPVGYVSKPVSRILLEQLLNGLVPR